MGNQCIQYASTSTHRCLHAHTRSYTVVGDTHKALAHPLFVRKHFNVAALAGPLKCNPSNQINFLVFIALLLLAYIKELIISGHFLLLCFVLCEGIGPPWLLWICVCVFFFFLHVNGLVVRLLSVSPSPSLHGVICVCSPICVCVCVTYVSCIAVR